MGDQKQILVFEDSPTQARFVSLLLEKAGYQVVVAGNGKLGLQLVETMQPALIILDVVLPDMDGFTVCQKLRQQIVDYVPILMFTEQRTSVQDRIAGLAIGADEYLFKPFDEMEIIARVNALIRIKQMIDELQFRLINEQQSYQTLKRIALTDHLTGVFNRHYLMEELDREFNLALRYNTALSCMMLDIDSFRDFNNQYGHSVGDWVLQSVANLIRQNLRQGDMIARYGGDEFFILLPMTYSESGTNLAERICDLVSINNWNSPTVGKLQITISLGIVSIPSQGIETPDVLIECADIALYKAKRNGGNCVERYSA